MECTRIADEAKRLDTRSGGFPGTSPERADLTPSNVRGGRGDHRQKCRLLKCLVKVPLFQCRQRRLNSSSIDS